MWRQQGLTQQQKQCILQDTQVAWIMYYAIHVLYIFIQNISNVVLCEVVFFWYS